LHTKAGYCRGGDYHKSIQHDIVLSGEILWVVKDKSTGKAKTIDAVEGKKTEFLPNNPHLMFSITDSLVLEWLERPEKKKKYYEPYRDVVEMLNK